MRKVIVLLLAVVAIACLAALAARYVSIQHLAEQERALRRWIAANRLLAVAAGLAVYYAVSLVPGTSGKSIVLGWLYGFWLGVVMVDVALTAAALTTFGLSRYVFREAIERRLGKYLARLDAAFHRQSAFYLLALRLMHTPYSLVNVGAGASRVRALSFAWTTALGLLPGTMVFVFLGTRLPTLKELVETGAAGLLDPWLGSALIALAALPVAGRWFACRMNRVTRPVQAKAHRANTVP